MRDELAEQAELAAHEAFGEVELGREIEPDARVEAARDRQHRHQHAEHEDKREAPQEVGDRQQQAGQTVDRDLRPTALPVGADDRHPTADQRRHDDRGAGQLERRRQPADDELRDVLAQADRGAEIAAHDVAKPDQELRRDRPVEAVEAVSRKWWKFEDGVISG